MSSPHYLDYSSAKVKNVHSTVHRVQHEVSVGALWKIIQLKSMLMLKI